VTTPLQAATAEITQAAPDLQAPFINALQTATDPALLSRIADECDKEGFHSAAELLRKRAASLSAVAAAPSTSSPTRFPGVTVPPPAASAPPPGPGPMGPVGPVGPMGPVGPAAAVPPVAPVSVSATASTGPGTTGPVVVHPHARWHPHKDPTAAAVPGTNQTVAATAPPVATPSGAVLQSTQAGPAAVIPTSAGPASVVMTPVQKAAVAMNSQLVAHGYKASDMPVYRAFQAAAGQPADGYPGRGTMGALAATLMPMNIPPAPVAVYPWLHTGAYDGRNAPTAAEWYAGQVPPGPAPAVAPPPGAQAAWHPSAAQQAAAIPAAYHPASAPARAPSPYVPAAYHPAAAPGPRPATAPAATQTALQRAATAMNRALSAHGYRASDMGLYKAFQAAAGGKPDGYPGAGTMSKLQQVLKDLGVPMAPVTIYPWRSNGAYDGKNAPPAAQWQAAA
jgi:hypothetical protein